MDSADRSDESAAAAELDDLQVRSVFPLFEVFGGEQESPAAWEAAEGDFVAAGEFVDCSE